MNITRQMEKPVAYAIPPQTDGERHLPLTERDKVLGCLGF